MSKHFKNYRMAECCKQCKYSDYEHTKRNPMHSPVCKLVDSATFESAVCDDFERKPHPALLEQDNDT